MPEQSQGASPSYPIDAEAELERMARAICLASGENPNDLSASGHTSFKKWRQYTKAAEAARSASEAHQLLPLAVADIERLGDENARLDKLLNTPEIMDFAKALPLEASHQRARWGTDHDSGKTPADWFWLIGYLAGKALHAQTGGNTKKALHHVITTAAALCNWHAAILGKTNMRPGIETPPEGEAA
jgi:hypothetical protein